MNPTIAITIGHRAVRPFCADGAPADLPDLSGPDWRDTASDSATNGIDSLYLFPAGDGWQVEVYVEQGVPSYVTVNPARDLAAVLWDCEPADGQDRAEFLAEWGQDPWPALRVAPEGYAGPCRVWVEPQYYAGTCNAPRPGYARDDNGEPLEFDTREAAAEYVREYYTRPSQYDGIPACNVLAHGQAGSGTLAVVRAE